VRWRLFGLIVIPTVVGVVVGGLQIVSSISAATQYQRVLQKAELSADITALTHQLERERDQAVYYVAAGRSPARESVLREQFGPVDAATVKVRRSAAAIGVGHGDSARTITEQILGRLPEILITRDTVLKSQLPALPALTKYSQIIAVFQQVHEQISQGVEDEPLSNRVRALTALVKAKDAASQQRGLLAAVVSVGFFQTGELDTFMAAHAQQDSEVTVFRSSATPDELQIYDDTVTGAHVDRAELFRVRAFVQASQGRLNIDFSSRADAERWFEAITDTINGMRAVEKRLTEAVIVQSRVLEESASRDAVLAGAASGVLLLVVFFILFVMARSLVKPLRILRAEALLIAGERLPEMVRSLRLTGNDSELALAPIGVDSDDEIGEVARAFDEVHREAVRLAGEESRLRANVNAMFVNLSRRSQTLVERQLSLIDGLEQSEQDAQRLSDLFKLDHLATRMRRNSENLLVLAGQDQPRRWHEPVELVDVVRASVSEVENYERVTPQVPAGISVSGQAVNDVVHLLAELMENALCFSPQTSRVTVSGSRIDGGGFMLSITDTGIGMTDEELAQANERLTNTPEVDVAVSRRMGLFVVARLAHRHGIRVQLRRHDSAGLMALVLLPALLLDSPASPYPTAGTAAFRQQEFTIGRATPALVQPAPIQSMAPGFASPWQPSSSWPSEVGGWPSPPAAVREPRRGIDTNAQHSQFPMPDTHWSPSPSPFGTTAMPDAGETEAATTGPIAAVRSTPSGEEYLPIFASLESAWFERNGGDSSWSSPQVEAGWNAAKAVMKPSEGGATASGLPKRVPKANLIPGSAKTSAASTDARPQPAIVPENVRSRLSGFQRGCQAARHALSTGSEHPVDFEGGV
jgi:signal transduction histidine kinase